MYVDICRVVKRRLKDAALPTRPSPRSFRVTTITDFLEQGVPLEDVQRPAPTPLRPPRQEDHAEHCGEDID